MLVAASNNPPRFIHSAILHALLISASIKRFFQFSISGSAMFARF
jgi:hypothetical protein